MPLLFSYGTLRDADVQRATFGRVVPCSPDALVGHALTRVEVTDPDFIRSSGTAVHANVVATGRAEDRVPGVVLDISAADLEACDRYEAPANYRRRRAALASGREAWVYAYAASPAKS